MADSPANDWRPIAAAASESSMIAKEWLRRRK